MTHRIRMARKRLMIARERVWIAAVTIDGAQALNADVDTMICLARKELRRFYFLRAIERRKDWIA